MGDLEIAGYRPGCKAQGTVESRAVRKFQVGDITFEQQADAEVFCFYRGVFQVVERDMGIAAVGCEDNGAEDL